MKQIFKRVTCICLVALMLSTLAVNAFAASTLWKWDKQGKNVTGSGIQTMFMHGNWIDVTTAGKQTVDYAKYADVLLGQMNSFKATIDSSTDEEQLVTAYLKYLVALCWLDFNILSPLDGANASSGEDATGNYFLSASGNSLPESGVPIATYKDVNDTMATAIQQYNEICNTLKGKKWSDTTDYMAGTYSLKEYFSKDNTIEVENWTTDEVTGEAYYDTTPRRTAYIRANNLLNAYVRNGSAVALAKTIPLGDQTEAGLAALLGGALTPSNVLDWLEEDLKSKAKENGEKPTSDVITNSDSYIVGDMPIFDMAMNNYWTNLSDIIKEIHGSDTASQTNYEVGDIGDKHFEYVDSETNGTLTWNEWNANQYISLEVPVSGESPGLYGTIQGPSYDGHKDGDTWAVTTAMKNAAKAIHEADEKDGVTNRVHNIYIMFGNSQFFRYFNDTGEGTLFNGIGNTEFSVSEANEKYLENIESYARHLFSAISSIIDEFEGENCRIYVCSLLPGITDETEYTVGINKIKVSGKRTISITVDSSDTEDFTKTHAEAVADLNAELEELIGYASGWANVTWFPMDKLVVTNGQQKQEVSSPLVAGSSNELNTTLLNPLREIGSEGVYTAINDLPFNNSASHWYDNYVHSLSLNKSGTDAIIEMLGINKKIDWDLNGSMNGFNNSDLQDLYNASKDKLLPRLRAYSNVRTYYEQLFMNGYASVKNSDGQEWRAYQFYDPEMYNLFNMGDLVNSLYDITFGQHSDMANGSLLSSGANDFTSNLPQDLNKSVLEIIANAKLDKGDIVWDEGEHSMTELGYIFLCAGVCYDPFNSTAGNETYLNLVLDRFSGQNGSEEQNEKVKALLQEAIQKKKPLYVTEGSKSSWTNEEDLFEIPVANYRIAFLSDVFQEKSSTVKAYAVVSGEMNPSAVDSSTWEYKSGGAEASTTGSATGTTDTTGATADTPTIQNNSSSAAQGSNVVAGTQLTAAGAEMSRPVLLTAGAKEGWMKGNWGAMQEGYAANVGGLTEIILHNARQDAKNNKHLQSADSEMLFLNGLGDIILSDNTIVLPAIANPIIYEYSGIQYDTYNSAIRFYTPETDYQSVSVLGGSGSGNPIVQGPNDSLFTAEDEASKIYDDTKGYYPYSAAFMNHYPSAIINMEGDLALSNKNDEGKYVITINTRGAVLARRIQSVSNRSVATLYYRGGGVTVPNIQALSFCVADNIDYLGNVIPFRSGSDKGDNWTNAAESTMYMTKDTPFNSNEQPFFPLIEPDAEQMEDFIMLASPLMTSAYRFLTGRTVETANKARDTFNMEHYVEMCGEGLLGTQYADTLIKNYKVSYDDMVDDTQGRFTRWLTQLTTSTVDTIGKIDGVLAIKNGYENTFFNLIVQFIQEFYLLIVIVLLIIVAIKFLRGHYNLIYVCFIGLLCLCGFEVYANWMPTIVPGAYNFAVNDAVEQIAWNTVAYNAESYTETYKDSDRKDATTGALKPYTATITLYKMSQDDMETVAARIGTTYESIKKGEVYYLDEAAGVFVQGDCIKMSVDKLLVNNSIRGMYYSQWKAQGTNITGSSEFIQPAVATYTDNPYLLELEEPYVSLEAYYIPFNEFERAFLANLNTFTQFFRLERNQFSYDRGLYKDAFVFNCFTNSGIFTAPGDRRVLLQNLAVGTLDTSRIQDTDMFLDEIEEYFMPEADWLNLDMVFEHPSVNMQDSLWGKTLQDRGWYDADWNITVNGRKELGELIGYINNMTKQFIIDNLDQLNFCSDENAIKLTTLYATTCFTHYVSEFGNWLYPNYLNAADMELKDVMYGSMTTLRDRNFAYDGTVVNTVALNLGFFGVLFIFFITIFATVFVFVMTYLVPILYAMFGAIIVLKLVLSKDGFGMVQGYIKVTLVTAILYFIFSLSLRLVEVGGYAWYGYLGCALIIFLCDYMMFWVCLSVVQNAGEMGNDVLGRNLLHGLDKLTHGAVSKLGVDRMFANRQSAKYGNGGAMPVPYQYGRHYNVDHYDPSRSSRRGLFGRGRSRTEDAYSAYGHGMSYDEAASYRDSDSHMPNFLRRATPEERAARREERRVQHETNRRRNRAARNVEYGDYDSQDL